MLAALKMRMNLLIVSTFVLSSYVSGVAQATDDLTKSVKTGFKTSNAKEIAPYLSDKTEIAFDGEKTSYSKEKVDQVLSKFLSDVKPKDFQMLHKGASKEGIKFYIGELSSEKGTYRVLIYLKNNVSKTIVESIDISKE